MIVSPDWSTLKGIANGLDHPDPIERKQATLRTLQLIGDALPDVGSVRLYQLDGYTLLVRAATDLPEMTAIPLVEDAEVEAAIESQQPQWLPAQKLWVSPLIALGQVVGVLRIEVERLDDEWLDWLQVLTEQIAPRVFFSGMQNTPTQNGSVSADLHKQGERLIKASRMLVASSDYDDAATAAMFVASQDVLCAFITVFDQPLSVHDSGVEGIATNQRYTLGVATHQQAQLLTRAASAAPLPELALIQMLRQEIPVLLAPLTDENSYLSDWLRQQIDDYGAAQMVAFGLVTSDQLIGTLELFYAQPRSLSESEVDIYTNLADQIAATILTKRMLQSSQEAQQFASKLIKTNKSLAVAESYEEMAQAVLQDAPPSIKAVAIALFNRPFTMMGNPANLRTRAIATRSKVYSDPYVDPFSAVEDARVTYFLHEFLEGRMMQLWAGNRPRRAVMAESLVDRLQKEDVALITAFGLNMRGSLRGLVVFAGDETLKDPGSQYDGLRAISDQLAAVIENSNLLQQTTEALDLIQTQYETSSRIFRTENLAEILQAVSDFAGGVFSYAELVTTDALGITRRVAEVTPQGARAVAEVVNLDDYPASQTLAVLEALEIRDVNEDTFIDDAERQALQAANIRSLVILPLLTGYDLSGLIMLSHHTATRIIPDRLRALRSITDQVGVVLENRKLLQNMELNLAEIQLLYEANRAMLRTQDIMDVLAVLKNNLATDASTLCMMSIQYDKRNRNKIIGATLDYELTQNDARMLNETLPATEAQLMDIYKFLRQIPASVTFAPKGAYLPNNPVNLFQDRYAIESFAAIVIKERGQVNSIIFLLFDKPKPFVSSTRRLYEAIADQVVIAVENQKLLKESQVAADRLSNQVQALQAISGLAVQLNKIRDENMLLETSAKALVEALKVDHAGVVLFNDDMQTGVVISEYPRTEFLGVTVNVEDNPILKREASITSAVIIEDVEHDDIITDTMRSILRSGNISSIIIVPLIGQSGELIGSVGLDVFGRARHFDTTEVQTAETIAAQMAVGLQNVRLLRAAQQRALQLQNISEFSALSQSTLDLDALIASAMNNIPKLLPVQHMTMTLYDPLSDALVLHSGWQEMNSFRTELPAGEIVAHQDTTTGYVFEHGEYLYIPNLQRRAMLHYPHSRTIATLLAMPLINQGRKLGVLTLGSLQSNAFTDTDIAVFQQLVNQLALVMDNARAYTESQKVARNKTLANEIAIKLQRQTDVNKMIDLAMSEVGQAIGAKRARVRITNRQKDNGQQEQS